MTGAYLRVQREGKWENIEIEHLTEQEIHDIFITKPNSEIVKWLIMLAMQIKELELFIHREVEDDQQWL